MQKKKKKKRKKNQETECTAAPTTNKSFIWNHYFVYYS